MKTILTPLHIDLLLHAYVHQEPWPHNGGCSEEYEKYLVYVGLLKQSEIKSGEGEICYECTEKGEAHVEQLCTLELPIKAWINTNGNVIFENSED